MNSEQQTRETANAYFDVQQRLLDRYQGVSQCFQPWTADGELRNRWEQLNERRLQIWENQARRMIDAQMNAFLTVQTAWTRSWVNAVNPMNYLPQVTDQSMQLLQRMAEDGTRAFGRAVDSALGTSQRWSDMHPVTDTLTDALQRTMDSLEESCRKTQELQQSIQRKLEDTANRMGDQEQRGQEQVSY